MQLLCKIGYRVKWLVFPNISLEDFSDYKDIWLAIQTCQRQTHPEDFEDFTEPIFEHHD